MYAIYVYMHSANTDSYMFAVQVLRSETSVEEKHKSFKKCHPAEQKNSEKDKLKTASC